MQSSLSDPSKGFSAAYRLAGPRGFDRVLSAYSMSDGCFRVFFAENQKNNARLGMIVGKRLLFRAVDRNMLKRRIREAFRQHSIRQRSLDMVVMLRRGRSQKDGDLAHSLRTLFSRVESRCAGF